MGRRSRGALLIALLLTALRGSGFVGQAGSSPRVEGRRAEEVPTSTIRKKIPVVLCPAQFGTAEDYEELKVDLDARGFALYPAPLSRLDWLRIVPSTLTKEFFTAELRPKKTLGFFYEALDQALAQIDADFGPKEPVAFLGHSIGGWVARSYIGEVLGSDVAQRRVRSLVTLGTPHQPPPEESPVAILDQTRGLLTYINDKFPAGYPLNSSAVTCVAGCGTKTPPSMDEMMDGLGEKIWNQTQNRSTFLEEVVALASYLPLSGSTFGVEGDGLIPVNTALMEGCGSVILDDCNHADFVPMPGESIRLPKSYQWYGSAGFLDSWVKFL